MGARKGQNKRRQLKREAFPKKKNACPGKSPESSTNEQVGRKCVGTKRRAAECARGVVETTTARPETRA